MNFPANVFWFPTWDEADEFIEAQEDQEDWGTIRHKCTGLYGVARCGQHIGPANGGFIFDGFFREI